MTYDKIIEYIDNVPKFTKKNGLEHTRMLLKLVGNPQNDFKVLHVAGSNGKGSVCSFLNAALLKSGKETGLFVSPHLVDLEERFVINGRQCSREELMWSFDRVMDAVEQLKKMGEPHPSYFELLFVMGMVLFQKRKMEYVILETGLGGRLDATNSILQPVYTVITSISLEHTEILGDTIEKIAGEKAGIIKQNVPVIFDGTEDAAAAVIKNRAEECHAPAYEITGDNYKILQMGSKSIDFSWYSEYDSISLTIPFVAEYQVMNASLALRVLLLMEQEKQITREDILQGMARAVWPGRMEQVQQEVFLDGAHNVSGIRSLLKTVSRISREKPILLFSMVKEKDYELAVELLVHEQEWEEIIVTTIPNTRGIPANILAEEFVKEKHKVRCIEDNKEAWTAAIAAKRPGQLLICTGSLYLVGELKKIIGGL